MHPIPYAPAATVADCGRAFCVAPEMRFIAAGRLENALNSGRRGWNDCHVRSLKPAGGTKRRELSMHKFIIGTALTVLALAPMAAHAQILQGTENGTQQGAAAGDQAGGPLGGLFGGAVGAGLGTAGGALGTATGTVDGVFGQGDGMFGEQPAHPVVPSFAYNGDLQVGTILPRRTIPLYPVPMGYDVDPALRYTFVNNHEVLVDPRTREVVQIIF
jgi:hypothetical protein